MEEWKACITGIVIALIVVCIVQVIADKISDILVKISEKK